MSDEYTRSKIKKRFNVALAPDETPLQVYTRYGIVFLRSLLIALVLLMPAGVAALFRFLLVDPTPFDQPARWPLILIGINVLVALAYLSYKFADWRNDALILTDQRLIYIEQTILLAQKQRETALGKVQNIRFIAQGLVARIFDYGNIYIETAARGSDIWFGPIHHADQAQREIMARVQGLRVDTSAQLMRQTLLHRLYPDQEDPPDLPVLAGEELGAKFQGRFHLPFLPPNPLLEGDSITWHKHGYFLFLRIFRALILLGLLGGAIFLLRLPGVPSVFWLPWVLAVLGAIGYLVVQYQLWMGDIYVATSDRLHDIYRTPFGLLGESRRSAPLERIQNISYDKPGLIPNLLNFGDVRIQTAGEEDLTFDRVPRPEEVQSEIYRRQEIARLRQQQREREEIADWLLTYHQIDRDILD
jgi:uncharacterized membrane protein YdbT with pleckstrin-like domain